MSQFAGLCCSIMKAASTASTAAAPPADYAYFCVAEALEAGIAGMLRSDFALSWHGNCAVAFAASLLAISGRVLQCFATREQGASIVNAAASSTRGLQVSVAAGATCSAGMQSAAASGPLPVINMRLQLQMESLALCDTLTSLLILGSPASQQLSTAGYDVVSLQLQVHAFMQSLPNGCDTESLTGEQLTALQSLGIALSNVAFPCACNNPTCQQLAGPLELQLVSRRSCICAACRMARYCCRGCQRQHWKQHKPVCQGLAAAQASAATGQSAAAEASTQQQP